MQCYMVETVHLPFGNKSCLVCTPGNDFNVKGQRSSSAFFNFYAWGVHTRLIISPCYLS